MQLLENIEPPRAIQYIHMRRLPYLFDFFPSGFGTSAAAAAAATTMHHNLTLLFVTKNALLKTVRQHLLYSWLANGGAAGQRLATVLMLRIGIHQTSSCSGHIMSKK